MKQKSYSPESLEAMSRLLEIKLKEFGVEVSVDSVHPGPVITRFEIQPAAGVKVSRISNLAKDLARSLAVISVRVVEVIPGKTTVGIEIPNEDRQMVRFSEVLSSPEYDEHKSTVPLALGHDIGGRPIITDLAKMPHLLVAGTTGSGKSVGVNAMLLSILFKSTPSEARLIMIDPKMLELSIYEGIPHLLCPVVTDMKEAANALRWSVAEMERRYRLMAAMGVRNLAGFNRKVKDAEEAGTPLTDPLFRRESPDDEPPQLSTLPTIVVVVDEFADMMMIVGKKVEELIARIAQKARAAGIHLILATQRPSVDVITGLIKANIPTRIAFQVSSKIDSRTILDQGAPNNCSATATCSTCRRAQACRFAYTAPSFPTTRCTGWSRPGSCAARPTTSRTSSLASTKAAAVAVPSMAATAPAKAARTTRSTTRRYVSSPRVAGHRSPPCNAS